jgi:acetyl-CoA acetyltransferase
MEDVVIVGVGMSRWGKYPEKSVTQLAVEVVREALADAGLGWRQIQGIASAIAPWAGSDGMLAGNMLAAAMGGTGVPIQNLFNACAVGGSALRTAAAMIRTGEHEIALAVGADASPEGAFSALGASVQSVDAIRFMVAGASNPAFWALEARRRMETFGTTDEVLAMTKVVASRHGALNPRARYRKAFTLEDVLASPMVTDPLRLYEICATSDGAAAVILASRNEAKRLGIVKPVELAAVSLASVEHGDQAIKVGALSNPTGGDAPIVSDGAVAARRAFETAGVGPEDVDLLELPDNSAWHFLHWLELMGFYGPGDADRAIMAGELSLGGKLPVCPSGGFASFGEAVAAQGLAQVCELVWQLRGEAGDRQVEGARVGMSQVYGGGSNSGAVIAKA